MTYDCRNRDRPTGQGWKDDGACQHDSARDEKCEGCKWRREEEREIPQGDGGLSASTTRSIYDRKDERAD